MKLSDAVKRYHEAAGELVRVVAEEIAKNDGRPIDESNPQYVEANRKMLEAEAMVPWQKR